MELFHRGRGFWLLPVLVLATPMLLPIIASDPSSSGNADRQPESTDAARIIDRIVAGEKLYVKKLKDYSPRVETYLQRYEYDTDLGEVPKQDAYFLGRLSVESNAKEVSFLRDSKSDRLRRLPESHKERLHLDEFAVDSLAVDRNHFDREHYEFKPVRWEKLGDLRCLAIDVVPRSQSEGRAFEGRIWVEDRNYAIVRLNGTRVNPSHGDSDIHFDCWRENLRPGVWLPVYIFSQDSEPGNQAGYKAETRLWGYDALEWRKDLIHSPTETTASGRHRKHAADEMSTEEAQRRLDIAAEHNVLKRLERARLIAPPGPVDRVLDTVVNNLRITNHLDSLPPIDCRVLLTSTLESFSLAYSIVLSRGLIDVLPNEASLAMILAHELAHITLSHRLNSEYALQNGMDVPDEKLLPSMDLARKREDELAADGKGAEFLKNSPYKDKLVQAGLFLQAAADAARRCPQLFGAHVGNGLTEGGDGLIRMSALRADAPNLAPRNVDQIAALPLGSRVQVNPWDGSIAFTDRKAVPLIAAPEKMPFQVAPIIPYLKIYSESPKIEVIPQR